MDSASKETIRVGDVTIDFLVDADDSGGSVTVFECGVPADAKVPVAHSHDGFEETIYGLVGELTFTIGGHDHLIGVGESVCVRRGQVHGFDNRGSADAKFLAIATPGCSGRPTSTRSAKSWPPPPDRPISSRWPRSCDATG